MSKTKKFHKSEKSDSRIIHCKLCKRKTLADEATFSEYGMFCSDMCAEDFWEKKLEERR